MVTRGTRPLVVFAALLLLAFHLSAQTVQWDPPGGRIVVGRTMSLRLVCRDCEPSAAPAMPRVDGLISRYTGTTTNYDFSGGSGPSAQISYVFAVHWTKNEPLILPTFTVGTNRGAITVPEARYEPEAATIGGTGRPLSTAASAAIETNPPSVWVGQVFAVSYRIEADLTYQPDFDHVPPDWQPAGLVAEDWSAPEPYENRVLSPARSGLVYRTRAVATSAGQFELQPARQRVSLNVGMNVFGLPTPRYEQFSVPCAPVTVTARALPPAPAGFNGAVGNFQISSRVVPQSAGMHEPITWTLEIVGQGNWPSLKSLPARQLPDGFKAVHPQVQRRFAPGKLFEGKITEDIVLLADKAGHFELPATTWSYFDPESGAYRTVSTAAVPIDIQGGSDSASTPPIRLGSESGAAAETPLAAPELPHGLPARPLPTGDLATTPLRPAAILGWSLCPFALLGVFWWTLALRRAWRNDPERRRREAWREQAAREQAIAAAAAGNATNLRSLLAAWQRAAPLVWGWRTPSLGSRPIENPVHARLWQEADAAIYGREPTLPADWVARAAASRAAARPPPFRWSSAWRWRNLFPFAAVLAAACILGVVTPAFAAESAAAHSAAGAYAIGDFAAAEAGWRGLPPNDPAARHNRSLALAQQNRWTEAAASAAAAFVQRPNEPAIRAQFAAACERAAIAPGPLTPFLAPGRALAWAETASPAQWQRLIPLAAALFCIGAACLLCSWYGIIRPAAGIAAGAALAILAILAAGAAAAAVRAYGVAADADAVWVTHAGNLRSIPTEAVPAQVSVPIAPGTIALPDRHFLGWVELRFPDGATGWLRAAELSPLWK